MKDSPSNSAVCEALEMSLRRAVDQVLTEEQLGSGEKIQIFEFAISLLHSKKTQLEQHCIPKLPTPGSDYPRYPGRSVDPLEWLETHWGKYLKYFGAEKDYLYQDQLRKLDPGLLYTLTSPKYRAAIESKGLKLRDIIPPKSARLSGIADDVLTHFSSEALSCAYNSVSRQKRREIKNRDCRRGQTHKSEPE